MATALADSCTICTTTYDLGHRQSVALPCGHDFCMSCLVRLKASGKCQCPTCRRNWAGFEVSALPGMEALGAALQPVMVDEEEMPKKKDLFDRCEKHSMPYDYWVTGTTEFFCRKCAKENRQVDIELIEEAIPQVKEALAAQIPNAMKKVESDLESLDENHKRLVMNRNNVRDFMKAVQTLDDKFNQEIKQNAASKAKVLESASELTKLKSKVDKIATPADLQVVGEMNSTVKKVAAHSSAPTSDLPQSLLSNIACSYVEEGKGENPPSKAAFVNAVQKYGTKPPSPETVRAKYGTKPPSPETVRAAEQLKGGQLWTVDHVNSEAALLALADRQPSVLRLVARDDAREALPVAALASAATGCEVEATFIDTFCSAKDTAQDKERLQHLTANKSLRLKWFHGHLDRQNISTLPTTITVLGLAIGSAADAAAVSALRPWKGLTFLRVSVSSRVAAEDLKPLPSGAGKRLFFPFLSDAGVDSVRPATEALVPDLRLHRFYFPKSQLTAAGARHLTQRLRGVKVWGVTIEASGTWQPGAEEKKSLEAELRSATGCSVVYWAMDWW